MKKRTAQIFAIIFLALLLCLPTVAYADMGPKPSTYVKVKGVDAGREYYVTLLSNEERFGPHQPWDGNPDHYLENPPSEPYLAFINYVDKDGFMFLQEYGKGGEKYSFNWTYYAPDTFKVLIYFADTKTFAVSDVQQRYAYDSYFTATVNGDSIEVARNYANFWGAAGAMLVRIVLTVAIELGIAWLFKFRHKRVLLLFGITNAVTQVVLNVLLYLAWYNTGALGLIFALIGLEFLVLFIETAVYATFINKVSPVKRNVGWAMLYALVANVVSFGLGVGLAALIPNIF